MATYQFWPGNGLKSKRRLVAAGMWLAQLTAQLYVVYTVQVGRGVEYAWDPSMNSTA